MENPFYKSIREQFERGRGLSMKQFGILAKAVGENAGGLEDCAAVREKLAEFVPGGFEGQESDPAIPGLLGLFDSAVEWRPPAKRGKKVYDDKEFVRSLADQYARRHSLSVRQVAALRRIVVAYKDRIPDYAKKIAGLGLGNGDGGQAK